MKTYIFNTSVLPNFGEYIFKKISIKDAKKILKKGFISAVGHAGTAELLSNILGVEIPFNRIEAYMEVGDKAIVFKLETRPPEGKILSLEELKELPYSLGLLERIG